MIQAVVPAPVMATPAASPSSWAWAVPGVQSGRIRLAISRNATTTSSDFIDLLFDLGLNPFGE